MTATAGSLGDTRASADVECDLQGRGVLVTRPAGQAQRLCRLIEAAGGRALPLPTVEIRPPADPDAALRCLAEPWHVLIFISRNAVDGALALVGVEQLARAEQRAAVGKATAQAMTEAGIAPTLLSEGGFDSEALLALPELAQVQGRRVLIVRGEGGRALLGETLTGRGAEVGFAEVYRRALPNTDVAALLPEWRRALHLLTATSDEILINLLTLVPASARDWLKQLPLVVLSERNAATAARLGFERVIAAGAGDEATLAALCRLAANAAPAPEPHDRART
jgi:uroporphyrinogen-III synthase